MPRSLVVTLLVSAGVLGMIACAAAPSKSPQPVTGDAAPAGVVHPPEIQDISMMMAEIRRWRTEMGLPPGPLDSTLTMFTRPGAPPPLMCTGDDRPSEGTCGEVCDLATHICDNATDICRIAGDMPANAWAADKCSKARASCKEADEKCCGCDEANLRGGGGGGDDDTDPEANNRFWN